MTRIITLQTEYDVSSELHAALVHDIHDCESCDPACAGLDNGHIVVTHPNRVIRDYNDIEKTRGFLKHSEAAFEFIGPDREPVHLDPINKCLQIANIIRDTGCPNYPITNWPEHLLFQA